MRDKLSCIGRISEQDILSVTKESWKWSFHAFTIPPPSLPEDTAANAVDFAPALCCSINWRVVALI